MVSSSPLELIPEPERVQERLAELARERLLLRDLLRLAKRKRESLRRERPEGQEAARGRC